MSGMSGTSATAGKCVEELNETRLKKCSFSIDHILHVAGGAGQTGGNPEEVDDDSGFAWLQCTRYRPPKLPRNRRKEGVQRRKSGRNPRIPFSSSQVAFLEAKFLRSPYLSSSDVTQLAAYLQLSETRVKIWFQNRRARERRDREGRLKEGDEVIKDYRSVPDNCGAENSDAGRLCEQPPPAACRATLRCQAGQGCLPYLLPLDLSDRQFLYK